MRFQREKRKVPLIKLLFWFIPYSFVILPSLLESHLMGGAKIISSVDDSAIWHIPPATWRLVYEVKRRVRKAQQARFKSLRRLHHGLIAQRVEQRTFNP